jgi:UDP-glucose 4-epimerase
VKILVTGGVGYIGSHACVVLLQAGYDVVVLDNLNNSQINVLQAVEAIAGRQVEFIEGDVRDAALLQQLFSTHKFDAVIHFAGLKAVGESVMQPLDYYANNVTGTLTLLAAMDVASVKTLIFSSSATVYGNVQTMPLTEAHELLPATNPYGRSKLMVEWLLADLVVANPAWHIACLRYFNPVGAHESGLIGEAPCGVPNNLMPYLSDVAFGLRESLTIFGGDYPTPDGTGMRDYIHVMDLVEGHVAALKYLKNHSGLHTFNLGTGRGLSVLELVRAFETSTGQAVPFVIGPRRVGDVAACWADATSAYALLGWHTQRTLEDICRDTWRWVSEGRVDE